MEVLFAIPVLMIPLLLPLAAGFMARSFGRSFKFWFWISIPFPVIAHCILICLPETPAESKNEKENKKDDEHHFIGQRKKAG